jgi:SET domain-containing protein
MVCKLYESESKIPNSGVGVFASENIRKGDVVCLYTGYLISMRACRQEELNYAITVNSSEYLVGVGIASKINDNINVPVTKIDKKLIQHSGKEHNVKFSKVAWKNGVPKIKIIAIRDINENEELYISYGSGYWESRLIWT